MVVLHSEIVITIKQLLNLKFSTMKTNSKINGLTLVAMLILFGITAQAQNTTSSDAAQNYDQGFRLGFGLNAGLPTNNDVYNYALGADVRLQYDLSQRYSVVLTSGFTNLFINNGVKDLGFIPVKAGFKAFVWENQFYVLGEVGGGIAVTTAIKKIPICGRLA